MLPHRILRRYFQLVRPGGEGGDDDHQLRGVVDHDVAFVHLGGGVRHRLAEEDADAGLVAHHAELRSGHAQVEPGREVRFGVACASVRSVIDSICLPLPFIKTVPVYLFFTVQRYNNFPS